MQFDIFSTESYGGAPYAPAKNIAYNIGKIKEAIASLGKTVIAYGNKGIGFNQPNKVVLDENTQDIYQIISQGYTYGKTIELNANGKNIIISVDNIERGMTTSANRVLLQYNNPTAVGGLENLTLASGVTLAAFVAVANLGTDPVPYGTFGASAATSQASTIAKATATDVYTLQALVGQAWVTKKTKTSISGTNQACNFTALTGGSSIVNGSDIRVLRTRLGVTKVLFTGTYSYTP